jgi:hypothetical protein
MKRQNGRLTSIDLELSFNNTVILSESENIKKRRLSSARSTHESDELSRLGVSLDFLEKLSLSALDINGVVEIPARDQRSVSRSDQESEMAPKLLTSR